jgi:outer membrane lipoprotein LolB
MIRRLLPVAAALLASCAHLPLGTDGLTFEQRRSALEQQSQWAVRGRIAVDTGERGFQGRFNWQQTGDALDLTVRSPLGAGILEITGTPQALTLTARGETRVLDDPETQLSELLGWWLPVGSLHAWLLGLPDPRFQASTEPGLDGTLASLEQRFWRVEYGGYQLAPATARTGRDVLIPRRIDLADGPLKLRVTIDDWHPVAAAAAP